MTRSRRIVVPGVPHHLTQRGDNRADVYCDGEDRELFLDLIIREDLKEGPIEIPDEKAV